MLGAVSGSGRFVFEHRRCAMGDPSPLREGSMTGERWAQIKALFDGTYERPPEERTCWLSQACGGDEAR